jgi:hypothetical protein
VLNLSNQKINDDYSQDSNSKILQKLVSAAGSYQQRRGSAGSPQLK